jgi:hypothetical protein
MATTNHFEKMERRIPALFRPGRLTPFKVDYLDQKTINELVKYYFGRRLHDSEVTFDKLNENPEITLELAENHTVPTSFLVEMAQLADGNFQWFKDIVLKYEAELSIKN